MARLAIHFGLLLTLSLLAASAQAAPPPPVDAGGDCTATVHAFCSTPTANGPCVVALGGNCVAWTDGQPVGIGGQCTATVHFGCGPSPGAPTGYCITAVNGRCIIY